MHHTSHLHEGEPSICILSSFGDVLETLVAGTLLISNVYTSATRHVPQNNLVVKETTMMSRTAFLSNACRVHLGLLEKYTERAFKTQNCLLGQLLRNTRSLTILFCREGANREKLTREKSSCQ